MKTFKVMRTYGPVGEAGKQVKLKEDKFTQSLLNQGIIAELKVSEPTEKKTTKSRSKKAD